MNPELNKTQAIIAPARSPWATSVFLAIVLTVIYPGIGQIYNGQFIKAAGVAVAYSLTTLVSEIPVELRLIAGLIIVVLAATDAALICKKRAGGIHVTQSDWF